MRGGDVAVWPGTLDWVDSIEDSTVGETGPVAIGGSTSSGRERRGT